MSNSLASSSRLDSAPATVAHKQIADNNVDQTRLTDGAQTRDRHLVLHKVIDLAKLCTNYVFDNRANEATGNDPALVVSSIVMEIFEAFPTNFNSQVDPMSIIQKLSTKVDLLKSRYGGSAPLGVAHTTEKFRFNEGDLKTSKWARKAHRKESSAPASIPDPEPTVPARIQEKINKKKGKGDDMAPIEVNRADKDSVVMEQVSTATVTEEPPAAAPTYRIIAPSNRVSNKLPSNEVTPIAGPSSGGPKKRVHEEEPSGKENEEAPVKKRSKKRKEPLIPREGSRKSSRVKKAPE